MTAGTKPELVVLMDIPNVKAHRARLLYAAGLRTAEAVAGSTEATLMSILAKGESSSALCDMLEGRVLCKKGDSRDRLLSVCCWSGHCPGVSWLH